MRTSPFALSLLITISALACQSEEQNEPAPEPAWTEEREPCADNNPLKNLYFGDLHVHTKHSFDAWAYDIRVSPAEAYEFAQGKEVLLPPLDEKGVGTRPVRLERPLDFAAITDHADLLAETLLCADPDSPVHDTTRCQDYNGGGGTAVDALALILTGENPNRLDDICGVEGVDCSAVAQDIWSQTKQAAEEANDRSAQCSFTAFQGYEYTAVTGVSNLHRNVIFRGSHSLEKPISLFEAPTARKLWEMLDEECLQSETPCDVLSIPHNSNWSNGKTFHPEWPKPASEEEKRTTAQLRAKFEPVVEMFQHKGDAECRNDFPDVLGDDDPLCNFEKMRRGTLQDCGEETGAGAMIGIGCLSRRDFTRYALIDGLKQEASLGVNPFKLGMIGGTDTHNGTPGMVSETKFPGHVGIDDDDPEELLSFGGLLPGGVLANPGGLVAVWAEENSRNAIFEAIRKREVYATSGTRISVRLFGGWDLEETLCSDPAQLEKAYEQGVPMGDDLPARTDGAPSFLISALADPGTSESPGMPLERIQIIKGWIDENGSPTQRIFEVAGAPNPEASVDLETCEATGEGHSSLCSMWTDPEFNPDVAAVYYARILENPTCRYHMYICNQLPEEERPLGCDPENMEPTIQERAWTSPIWYTP